MMGGDGSGPKEVAAAIDRLTTEIQRRSDIHFDAEAVEELSTAVDKLRASLEVLSRGMLAALASNGTKEGARALMTAFENLRTTMKGRP